MTRAFIPSIAATAAMGATLLVATGALADHKGHGSAHVAAGVELGPRLSSRLQTSIPDGAQARVELPDGPTSAQAATPQPAPKRNVRVVYPGPFTN